MDRCFDWCIVLALLNIFSISWTFVITCGPMFYWCIVLALLNMFSSYMKTMSRYVKKKLEIHLRGPYLGNTSFVV